MCLDQLRRSQGQPLAERDVLEEVYDRKKRMDKHQCAPVAKDAERTCFENLEKFQRRVSNVLNIMTYQNKNGSSEIEIERKGVGCVPNDGGM